jgi:PAS domain S-box-containing protein
MNILIVDDMADNICMLEALLEGAGHRVVSAQNGKEALERLSEGTFDVIVSDVLMPVMDGFQLCRECKSRPEWREIPFLFYTATYTEKKDEAFALSLGADAYILKPQEPEVFLEIIAGILELPELRGGSAPKDGGLDEMSYLAEHNRRLVEKLEKKMTALEETNRSLQASEEKYRLVVDNAAEAILIAQDERIQFANPGCVGLLGRPQEVLTSRPFMEFIHSEDRELVLERHRNRFKGEEVPPVYSFRVVAADGTVKWVEIHAIKVPWKGRPATLNFLNDITQRKRAEEALDGSVENLRKALHATVQAIARVVEARDPYTAGHQRRVADLSRAIAAEMGLAASRIEGIHMAATIHDIGKISVPAEILSKPTKLTETEFALIKVHPQAGYDILRGIEFPWPIAQVILQHHEKMDGSGYPQGLKGEEINLKARILAVADAVEAIASHRPYRPSLGVEVALKEILRRKGVFYDPEGVDVCLKLFREGDYKLLD